MPAIRRNCVSVQWTRIQVSRNLHCGMNSPFSSQFYLALSRSHLHAVHTEIYQVTSAVGYITAANAQSLQPGAVIERPIDSGINATLANARIRDAWKIGLTGNPRSESDVQRVIPDIEFPGVRRIHRGNEIHRARMRHVHDVLVRADRVEPRNFVVGYFPGLHLESKSRVCKPCQRSLRLRPA